MTLTIVGLVSDEKSFVAMVLIPSMVLLVFVVLQPSSERMLHAVTLTESAIDVSAAAVRDTSMLASYSVVSPQAAWTDGDVVRRLTNRISSGVAIQNSFAFVLLLLPRV